MTFKESILSEFAVCEDEEFAVVAVVKVTMGDSSSYGTELSSVVGTLSQADGGGEVNVWVVVGVDVKASTRGAGVGAGRSICESYDSIVWDLSEERVDSVARGMGVVSFLLTAAKGRAEVDTVDSGNVSIGEVVVEERGAVAGYLDDGVMDNPVGPLFNAFGDFVGGEVPGAPDAVSKSAPDGVEHARLAGSGSNEVADAGVEGVGVKGVVEAVAGNGRNVTVGEEMVHIVVTVVAEKAASSGVNSGGGRKGIVSKHDAGGAGIAGKPARERVEVGNSLITAKLSMPILSNFS